LEDPDDPEISNPKNNFKKSQEISKKFKDHLKIIQKYKMPAILHRKSQINP
jgi:hypothetical protein